MTRTKLVKLKRNVFCQFIGQTKAHLIKSKNITGITHGLNFPFPSFAIFFFPYLGLNYEFNLFYN